MSLRGCFEYVLRRGRVLSHDAVNQVRSGTHARPCEIDLGVPDNIRQSWIMSHPSKPSHRYFSETGVVDLLVKEVEKVML
jgi:hypothetical protein